MVTLSFKMSGVLLMICGKLYFRICVANSYCVLNVCTLLCLRVRGLCICVFLFTGQFCKYAGNCLFMNL